MSGEYGYWTDEDDLSLYNLIKDRKDHLEFVPLESVLDKNPWKLHR